MKHTYLHIVCALLPFPILAGCAKEEPAGHEISFSVQLAGESDSTPLTKAAGRFTATDLDTISQFPVWGYDGTEKDIDNRTVKKFNSGVWGFEDSPLVWIEGRTRTFWATANLPSYVSFSANGSTQATVSVTTVPSAAASQCDPLVGFYSGTGNSGKAPIIFYHPLAAVQFVTGNTGSSNISAITGVKMKNVHKGGTGTTSNGLAYTWTPSGTTSVTGSFTGGSSTVPFILIPQNLASDKVDLEITVTQSGSSKTMYATLNSGSWVAGTLNTYTLDYNNDRIEANLTVTLNPWGKVTNNNGTPGDTSDDKDHFNASFD